MQWPFTISLRTYTAPSVRTHEPDVRGPSALSIKQSGWATVQVLILDNSVIDIIFLHRLQFYYELRGPMSTSTQKETTSTSYSFYCQK